jgi:hypothetical protein
MDTQTTFCIVSSAHGRHHRATRKVSPYFSSLNHAVRALKFMRDRLPKHERLHIEQSERGHDFDA